MFYIFLIAVINLALGFAAAMHLGRRYNSLAVATTSSDSTTVEEPIANDSEDDLTDSSMDLGMDEDDELPGDTFATEDEDDELAGISTENTGDSNSDQITVEDTDVKRINNEESTEQPKSSEPDKFDEDLDKLFENLDI